MKNIIAFILASIMMVAANAQNATEGAKFGYVPEMQAFENSVQCHESRTDAFNCCKYYLSHTFGKNKMKASAAYILNWFNHNEDAKVVMSPELMSLDEDENRVFLIAFMAANIEYELNESITDKNHKDQYGYAIVRLLNYYNDNRMYACDVPLLDMYNKLYDKNPNLLYSRLEQDYDQARQSAQLVALVELN